MTEIDAKINKCSCELFKLPHALYLIKIGSIYNIGAVGRQPNILYNYRLYNRLSSHRSIYA